LESLQNFGCTTKRNCVNQAPVISRRILLHDFSYPIAKAYQTLTFNILPGTFFIFLLHSSSLPTDMTAPRLERVCLVTVGATAGFKKLVDSVLLPSFWQYITSQGFTELHIQCGPDVAWASKQLTLLKDDVPSELTIDIFDVKKNLMKEEMILCKDVAGKRQLGLIISHAGMLKQ
jgi:hypothetical protein